MKYNIELLFSTYVSMADLRHATIGAAFKPNYKRPFFTHTENLFFPEESLCKYGSLFRSGVPWR